MDIGRVNKTKSKNVGADITRQMASTNLSGLYTNVTDKLIIKGSFLSAYAEYSMIIEGKQLKSQLINHNVKRQDIKQHILTIEGLYPYDGLAVFILEDKDITTIQDTIYIGPANHLKDNLIHVEGITNEDEPLKLVVRVRRKPNIPINIWLTLIPGQSTINIDKILNP